MIARGMKGVNLMWETETPRRKDAKDDAKIVKGVLRKSLFNNQGVEYTFGYGSEKEIPH